MPPSKITRKTAKAAIASLLSLFILYESGTHLNPNWHHTPGDVIDSYNGIPVHYNGGIAHEDGRNMSADGYNLGLRWQCVEFVKRYYFEHYRHRMPETRGNARDFFDKDIASGALNPARGLLQFGNDGATFPQVGDIVIFDGWILNPYGHVAIVTRIDSKEIEIVQQNPGPFGASREHFAIDMEDGKAHVAARRLLGWLRHPPT